MLELIYNSIIYHYFIGKSFIIMKLNEINEIYFQLEIKFSTIIYLTSLHFFLLILLFHVKKFDKHSTGVQVQ